MNNFLKKIIGDKRAWWKMEARAKALPSDYQVVYDEIKQYTCKFSAVNATDNISVIDLRRILKTEGRVVIFELAGVLEKANNLSVLIRVGRHPVPCFWRQHST